MRPLAALLVLGMVCACTPQIPEASQEKPTAVPGPSAPPPAIKRADRALDEATKFMTAPRAQTPEVIRAMEQSARLRNDIKVAKKHGTKKTLERIERDVDALKETLRAQ